jgi:hypothetical protein
MERSAMRGQPLATIAVPDFASLHPGYVLRGRIEISALAVPPGSGVVNSSLSRTLTTAL